ncbi:MAG: RsmF rRNA methyltransferase first C-terminal domain-containing protein [Chloroflexota bacterium]
MHRSDTTPPSEFLDKMRGLLGNEFPQFAQSFGLPSRIGLRVNTLKVSAEDFSSKQLFALSPIGNHEPAGFFVTDIDAQPGKHPYHAAGLYYLQEPAAMVVGSLVAPQAGDWVLDLAAAPGGKTTHLASLLGDTGLLVANDVHQGRARILAQNLERWGTKNTLITNATAEQLANGFGALFDRVLVDAPCSGEGMFRRIGSFEWSEEMVLACSRRQHTILDEAARLVRPGGLLVYATCTFSPEENEGVIGRFLANHPNFSLEAAPIAVAGKVAGRPFWTNLNDKLSPDRRGSLAKTLRLWPHHFPGEGQFVALLRRQPDETTTDYDLFVPQASPEARRLWRGFADACLRVDWDERRLHEANGRLYFIPPDAPATHSLRLVRYGLLLGELRRNYFRPAHTLALALQPNEAQKTADFAVGSPELARYLAGQDLAVETEAGWILIMVDGFGIGWGKGGNGRLKNHYPKGLRQHS